MKNWSDVLLGVSLISWVVLVICGFKILLDYSKIPGPEGNIAAVWPVESKLTRTTTMPTLVMTTHAQCPCSRASIEELAKIMSKVGRQITAHVIVIPAQSEAKDSYAWRRATETPGLQTYLDINGHEARKFGAIVSGKVMLYSPSGDLVFHGGITAGRGHEGDNAGSQNIIAYVLDSTKNQAKILPKTPVFGCGL